MGLWSGEVDERRIKMRKRLGMPGVVHLVIPPLLLIVLAACGNEVDPGRARPTPQVEVITVTPKTVPDEPVFIGRTEAFRPVEIRSQVTGIIKKVLFTEGRRVKKGDRLYLIDPVPFRAALLSATAQVAQAKARLVQAERDLARVKPLLDEQAVSQKDVDDAVAENLAAKAALEAARAEVVRAKWEMDNTTIVAPISGRTEKSRRYEGRLVAAQTDLLTVIHQLDPMYVTVNAPESYLLRRRRELAEKRVQRPELYKLRGIMTFADGTVYPHEGKLDFADVALRSETGSLQGRFVFPNPDAMLTPGRAYVFPGQFVKIRVIGYVRTDAILIPQRAVQQGPKGTFVNVVSPENTIEVRPVKASLWHDQDWLIEEGLAAGERVVVEGFHRIQPGITVEPIPFQNEETAPGTDGQPQPVEEGR